MSSQSQIHDVLRQEIVELILSPGTRLSEARLAERFGTSRSPARCALIRLAEEGLVEVWPQRGTFASRISAARIRRARFIREAIEVAIVHRLAQIGLSATALDDLRATLASQHEGAADPQRFMDADDAFHRALFGALGFGDFWTTGDFPLAQLDRLRLFSLSGRSVARNLVRQHAAILAAILDCDADAAASQMKMHVGEIMPVLEEAMAKRAEFFAEE